jgi:hypothetical protein
VGPMKGSGMGSGVRRTGVPRIQNSTHQDQPGVG